MKLSIVALPDSGKTTVFNALTKQTADTSASPNGRSEPNVAMVRVPDVRLDVLANMYDPKKVTPVGVQYVDINGLGNGTQHQGGLPPATLNTLGAADALLYVIRAFEDDTVPHHAGSIDVERDVGTLDLELIISDLAIVEKRLERLATEIGKIAKDRDQRMAERDLLNRLKETLESGRPIRDLELTAHEEKVLRGYRFLTAKPALVVLNIGEDHIQTPPTFTYNHRQSAVVAFCGKIEAELAQMDDGDAREFMDHLDIKAAARDRVIATSYNLLGLMSFLTVGPDEVRAWTVRQGTPAGEAAGTIHSDIQRGFIRAEVVHYDDLVEAGSMQAAKKQGTVRIEGKDYIVQDGDICHFLFNV